jgi:hypothetical protein
MQGITRRLIVEGIKISDYEKQKQAAELQLTGEELVEEHTGRRSADQ